MTESQKSESHKSSKKYKKKFLSMLTRTTNTAGWLSLMYFLWVNVNEVGIIMSLVMIFLSDIIDVLSD